MFDEQQQPLARWGGIEKLLNEHEADLERTREMASILADYGLLGTVLDAGDACGGEPLNLTGMHRVNEPRAKCSPPTSCAPCCKGHPGAYLCHPISLDNLAPARP